MIQSGDLKKWVRSGSWDFVANSRAGKYSTKLQEYMWQGKPVYYRAGTSDAGVIHEVLIRPSRKIRSGRLFGKRELEYWVPDEIRPNTILDIGGNIGVTSVYYSHIFPDAKIYSFEPVRSNFNILEKNIGNRSNVTAYNVGLGDEDKNAVIYACEDEDNEGGFSLYDMDVNKEKAQEIRIRHAQGMLDELDITEVDLIKIDTEGAEYDILMTIDPGILSNVKWIIGELHGKHDFDLLAYLSRWFDVGLNKSLNSRLFQFNARSKKYAADIPWRG